ncbi:BrnA antitoxin family protein [Acidisoma cladoniae]|jgi:uncharacterized protein (DUF4415 family)|uniref:BrnA antitoxin family protein n=1 Tax=Acidisoma cladoniae TaxID=3040935 RepID=UPI00254A0E75|nr:BrnA antitoxin family protein [Acidisoma sp. PAMC 29798]
MSEKPQNGESDWVDPDDAPELTADYFDHADWYNGETLIRRGRPRLEVTKQQVTVRLDADVLTALRGSGEGWQSRMNAALRDWLKLGSKS